MNRREFLKWVGLSIALPASAAAAVSDADEIVWFGRKVPYRVVTNRNECGPPLTRKQFEDFIDGARYRPWHTCEPVGLIPCPPQSE